MIHETYEGQGSKEVIINDLINKNLNTQGPSSKGELLGKLICQGLLNKNDNLQTEHLINKKSLNKDEYQRLSQKMNEISNELIEGMSHFDENLKLKLQMNVDLISQDQAVWLEKMQKYHQNIRSNLKESDYKKLTSDQLSPPYFTNCDQSIKNNIEKLWKIVAKLKIDPFHQDLKPVTNRDDQLNNIFKIKKQ